MKLPYGFGIVGIATILGFFVGLYVYDKHTPSDLFTIQVLGFIALIGGLMSMLKIRGYSGAGAGFITGFGLGVTFGNYFLPTS